MRADGAVDKQLQQIGTQHVPVVIVVLLALVAAHYKSTNSLVRQQSFVYGQIGQVGLDGHPLLLIEGLARLDCLQCGRRVTGVVGKRIGRQTRRQVVAHPSTLRKHAVITPEIEFSLRVGLTTRSELSSRPDMPRDIGGALHTHVFSEKPILSARNRPVTMRAAALAEKNRTITPRRGCASVWSARTFAWAA